MLTSSRNSNSSVLPRILVFPAVAALAITTAAIGPAALRIDDSYAATVATASARVSPSLSVKAWRTAAGAPRIKVKSNAKKVKLKVTGHGQKVVRTAKTNKNIKLPGFAKKVKLKTLGNKHVRPSGWHTVKIPAKSSAAPGGNSG